MEDEIINCETTRQIQLKFDTILCATHICYMIYKM
jgi:hypothetical protein